MLISEAMIEMTSSDTNYKGTFFRETLKSEIIIGNRKYGVHCYKRLLVECFFCDGLVVERCRVAVEVQDVRPPIPIVVATADIEVLCRKMQSSRLIERPIAVSPPGMQSLDPRAGIRQMECCRGRTNLPDVAVEVGIVRGVPSGRTRPATDNEPINRPGKRRRPARVNARICGGRTAFDARLPQPLHRIDAPPVG